MTIKNSIHGLILHKRKGMEIHNEYEEAFFSSTFKVINKSFCHILIITNIIILIIYLEF